MCSGILPFVILILINLFQTRMKKQLISVMVAASLLTACGGAPKTTAKAEKFDYTVEQFADLQILRYRVPEFENLSLKQKELVYYLTEAALQGRDILFDQNGKYNLRIRRMLEAVYTGYTGDKTAADFKAMEVYLKRVWFSNGIHHHYGCEKFVPGFTPEFFRQALLSVDAATLPLAEGQTVEQLYEEVAPVIFDPKVMPKRVNQAAGEDLVLTSACNYYDGVTQQEAEAFYSAMKDPKDETPVSYGLNSRLVKENGKIQEKVWKDTLEEEMRILYVAMTRAKRKLILTGTIKAQDLEAGLRLQINTQKWRATSAMDWLLPILADQFRSTQSEKSEEREGFLKNQETQKQAHSEGVTASWLKARLVNWEEILPFFEKERKQEEEFSYQTFMDTVVIPADVSMVEQSFSYEYPNRDATKWKRKYSVSELKTLSQTTLPEEESSIMLPEQNNFEEEVKMPEFLKEEKSEIAATARGTIIHKIMELLPFGQIQTKKQLFEWIDALKGTYPESEKISAKWLYRAIGAFLFSEIGEKLSQMDRQGNLRKELPFTVGLPVSLMNADTQAEDTVVVQGIIDICGEAEESLWLIDYKTDRIKEGEESLLLDRYGNQMLYYKAALEQILGKRVSESYLYSFSLKKFIPVNLQERSGENA